MNSLSNVTFYNKKYSKIGIEENVLVATLNLAIGLDNEQHWSIWYIFIVEKVLDKEYIFQQLI